MIIKIDGQGRTRIPVGDENAYSHSAHTRPEVEAVLAEAQVVKAEWDVVIEQAGCMTNYDIIRGPLAENLIPLNDLYLSVLDNEPCIVSRWGRHSTEPFPVATWQKEITKARRQIEKLRKAIAKVL